MNILLIGSGGREHALAWKMKQSSLCENLFVAPGNAGTASIATNVAINIGQFEEVGTFIVKNNINMLIVGPEAPLVDGIIDFFQEKESYSDLILVGPSKFGAILEGSKDFAKKFMRQYKIPTAQFATFSKNELKEGYEFLDKLNSPYVLKADGLAAGKGVLILDDLKEAKTELKAMLHGAKFGTASDKVVIEEYLQGIELSVFVLTDGKHFKILPEAKDYKRIGEKDTGPNTGGMGSVSPVPFADKAFMRKVEKRVIKPTIEGLINEKIDYRGFIFIGLMNVQGDPFVIEYNVRMGDPETQVVIPRIESDLVDILASLKAQRLHKKDLKISNKSAATVVQVAGGYPDKYNKGNTIIGLQDVTESIVFHAGTKLMGDKVITNGGRVLAISSLADNLDDAITLSYRSAQKINWNEVYYRKDIGKDVLAMRK
jgi:phosphoribosylamine---glycine ligase